MNLLTQKLLLEALITQILYIKCVGNIDTVVNCSPLIYSIVSFFAFYIDDCITFFFIFPASAEKQIRKRRWIGDKRTVCLLILVGASILGNIAAGIYWILTNVRTSEHRGNINYVISAFRF